MGTLNGRRRVNQAAKRLRLALHQFEAGSLPLTEVVKVLDILTHQHRRHAIQCQRMEQPPPTNPLDRLTDAHRNRLTRVITLAYHTRISGYENYY